MPHRPGARSSILAIALAWLAFTAAQPVSAQLLEDSHPDHAPCATEPQPGDGSWCYPKGKEIRVVLRQPYAEAIMQIGSDEHEFQAALKGQGHAHPRALLARWGGLSDAEDDTMRSIFLDASDRISALNVEITKEGEELEEHYSDDLAEKRFALIAQIQPIYDAVPGKLREEIGDEAANKAEAFFRTDWGKLRTETFVYFLRRHNMTVYAGDWPLPVQIPQAVNHD